MSCSLTYCHVNYLLHKTKIECNKNLLPEINIGDMIILHDCSYEEKFQDVEKYVIDSISVGRYEKNSCIFSFNNECNDNDSLFCSAEFPIYHGINTNYDDFGYKKPYNCWLSLVHNNVFVGGKVNDKEKLYMSTCVYDNNQYYYIARRPDDDELCGSWACGGFLYFPGRIVKYNKYKFSDMK